MPMLFDRLTPAPLAFSAIRALLLAVLLALTVPAFAAAVDDEAEPAVEVQLDALRLQLDTIPVALKPKDDHRQLVAAANEIQLQAERVAERRAAELAELDARLTGLGPAPEKGAPAEPADVAAQRGTLQKQRNALDSEQKLARLLAADARQRASALLLERRNSFQAELSERTQSPLGNGFWRTMRAAWPADRVRLQRLRDEISADLARAAGPDHREPLAIGLLAALLIGFAGNWLAERTLVRVAPDRLPPGRLRRSLLAVAITTANVAIIGLAAQIAYLGLDWRDQLGPRTRNLAQDLVHVAMAAAFIVGLGRALLSVQRSSWRLPPLSDRMATRLQPFPWLLAAAVVAVWLQREINASINASLEATVLTHGVSALLLSFVVTALLWRLRRGGAPMSGSGSGSAATGSAAGAEGAEATADTPAAEGPAPSARPQWATPVIGVLGVAVAAIWLLVVLGYVAMASFLAGQLVWAGLVGATFYLLFKFADDLCRALVSSRGAPGRYVVGSFDIAPNLLDQAAVVLSALARIALFFYMVMVLAAPLGTTVDELVQRGGKLDTHIRVGEFALVPGALFSALAVLALGFVGLALFKRWLQQSYFPSTALETGMRSSITTLLGYGGGVVVVASALSAAGIGVERIAWVASALSVGIGFGLQAIVQNFISGLILLVERPIKVGDWVIIGDTEGDVRRINVRATEIQLGDRSTLIVPNSEFVTKTVRNMTLINAEGRVLIRLPMPLTTDANRVRALMLEIFAAHPGVLKDPEPTVLLDGVEGSMLVFRATGYVNNPRLAGGVRSELLFTMLDTLNAENLPLMAYAAPPAPTPVAPAPPAGAAPAPATPESPLPAPNH